jgi:hypothetical protein
MSICIYKLYGEIYKRHATYKMYNIFAYHICNSSKVKIKDYSTYISKSCENKNKAPPKV